MFRFLLFGIVAVLFASASALPADTDNYGLLKHEPKKPKHYHTKTKPVHYYTKPAHYYTKTTTPPTKTTTSPTKTTTPPTATCPTTTGYYIQHVQDGEYAMINLQAAVGPDVFEVDVNADTKATATIFSFVQSNGGCQLTVFPGGAIPNAAGFRSVYYTDADGPVSGTFYTVFITGPVGTTDPTLVQHELYCQPDANLLLTCSFTPGGPLQPLSDQSDTLYVAGGVDDTPSDTFKLIPVV